MLPTIFGILGTHEHHVFFLCLHAAEVNSNRYVFQKDDGEPQHYRVLNVFSNQFRWVFCIKAGGAPLKHMEAGNSGDSNPAGDGVQDFASTLVPLIELTDHGFPLKYGSFPENY
ncbi:MAG: hypothetical protein Q8L69_05940 [Gallionellaceae bacterium]|nr:hypothetical protein [Gallionellaceae bacterium]